MSIFFNKKANRFHLSNEKISYQLSIEKELYVAHNYWGKTIEENNISSLYPSGERTSFNANPAEISGRNFSLATLLQEFPGNNSGDYRESALAFRYSDDSFVTQLEYVGYEIIEGKPVLNGLPNSYINSAEEADTLKIILLDKLYNIELHLFYTIFKNYSIITRSVQVVNKGQESIEIEKILSASVDFDHSDFDLIQLPGAWVRERDIKRHRITRGIHKIDSKRGTTGHNYQPFVGLVNPQATEHSGEAYGLHFVYTGEFVANVEVDEYDQTRVQMGINPEHFNWKLDPNETFQTPEVVMVYSDKGLNGMSQELHHFYQNQLVRGEHQFRERPVLINNWEGTYFDFTEDKIEQMADEAADLGVELFVLDDGWFGKRNSDTSSLGDWFVHDEKLPNGLKTLAEKIRGKGLKFGLWFEPEMISEDSELYRSHPEWVLKAPGREPSQGRDQYVLDFSQKDARDYITKQIKAILDEVPIDYIKWDYNRNMSEIGSQHSQIRDGEVSHRFILGLYDMLEDLTQSYPHILWESCSGGGGRYDPGMLYYMPQTWTSDNTDAPSRLEIQTGTSMVLPISSMGSHVSAIPNHQVNRMTTLEMRGDVAMAGNLGYELDVTEMNEKDKELVKEQIKFYKENRKLIQFGKFYRIKSPFEQTNETSWIFVDKEKEEALFFYYSILDKANTMPSKIKMIGLDSKKHYKVGDSDAIYSGSELMYKGVYIKTLAQVNNDEDIFQEVGDFRSYKVKLQCIENGS